MPDLTDKQKEDCQKILNGIVNYWWTRLKFKMLVDGLSFEQALSEIMGNILHGESDT